MVWYDVYGWYSSVGTVMRYLGTFGFGTVGWYGAYGGHDMAGVGYSAVGTVGTVATVVEYPCTHCAAPPAPTVSHCANTLSIVSTVPYRQYPIHCAHHLNHRARHTVLIKTVICTYLGVTFRKNFSLPFR